MGGSALTVVLVVIVFLVVLRQQRQPAIGPSSPPLPVIVPGNPAVGPGALYDPKIGGGAGPSTRQQIEVGAGSLIGAGAGLYICGGNPQCAVAGAYLGGTAAPYVSHGVENAGRFVANYATDAYDSTLGKIF